MVKAKNTRNSGVNASGISGNKQTRSVIKEQQRELKRLAREGLREQTRRVREFRHGVAVLKKQGILSRKYDARSVSPSEYLRRQISKNLDIVQGKAKTAKPSKSLLEKFKAQGYRTKGKRVVIPVSVPNARLHVGKESITEVAPKRHGVFEKVHFPIEYTDLRSYLEDIRDNSNYQKLKTANERWAFKFFGKNSLAVYSTIEQAIEDLDRYETISNAVNTGNAEEMRGIYQNLVFYRVRAREDWPRSPKWPKKYNAERDRRRRDRQAARNARIPEAERNAARKEKADYQKSRRANLTPSQKEAARAADRARKVAKRKVK